MTGKKLVTIGDSYMTPVVGKYAGTHFSEIIAEKMDYELICLCKQGLSNHGIAIAIEDAIKLKPDLILLGTTFYGRLIFPIGGNSTFDITFDQILIENPGMLTNERATGNTLASLGSYPAAPFHEEDIDAYYSVFRHFDKDYTNRSKAIKTYIEYLYHDSLNRKVEEWILYSVFHKLHLSKLNYIFVYNNFETAIEKMPWFDLNPNRFNKNYADTCRLKIFEKYNYHGKMETKDDPGYHTPPYIQSEIAEALMKKFIPHFL